MLLWGECVLVFLTACVHVCACDAFRKNVKASAVCRFSLTEVQEAFQGPYMENQDSGSNWKEYMGKIPDPRPGTVTLVAQPELISYFVEMILGCFNVKKQKQRSRTIFVVVVQCITQALRARGINDSTSLPDDMLDFLRRHPLMSQKIQPADRRPLLFRRTTHYTQLAVHMVQSLDGQTYTVLYMGTGEHKRFTLDKPVTLRLKMIVL